MCLAVGVPHARTLYLCVFVFYWNHYRTNGQLLLGVDAGSSVVKYCPEQEFRTRPPQISFRSFEPTPPKLRRNFGSVTVSGTVTDTQKFLEIIEKTRVLNEAKRAPSAVESVCA